jgi:hypothetical protein
MASGVKAGTAPEVAFSRHGGIYRSDVFNTSCKPGPAYRFPAGSGPGHKARRKKTRLPIVATSSDRLFLDRVGRHQSPSPLHRHSQTNMLFSQAPAKGDISTLPARGHFYFALTEHPGYMFRLSGEDIIGLPITIEYDSRVTEQRRGRIK